MPCYKVLRKLNAVKFSLIKNLVIFSLLFLISGCNNKEKCVCPEYYSPVCGNNGKTYINPCMAECDEVEYIDGECPVYGIGSIKFYGDSANNGCGYLIKILEKNFKPSELEEEFQEDNLIVSLKYRKLNDYFTCENPQGHYRKIEILEIQSY